jgi:hypothetical protein
VNDFPHFPPRDLGDAIFWALLFLLMIAVQGDLV